MMKFSRAISQVKWLYPEDKDRDGLQNVGFFTAQTFDLADSPRELHHTQSPGKQQISLHHIQLTDNSGDEEKVRREVMVKSVVISH
jgi:hypothetical protein